ncbi:PhzF family phenazine biosynthesis isomerase [Roseivirga sp. UBA838]|jgi:PhzF family phenazine biosynthesis protein|uniref:PhzF family phenazine biosynthesis protein n=1 Tax=Roseivirga sp. UBA838 TaxID=1947393 RepID=UPI00257D220A|nr:PhzF family phenazine biosynthesis isomerase [Roseivirga sp. UBA838]|tara:strand:- start:13794 stop:14588 length:795 start_codon:yes stop_codon:yes gene_type:complete
MKLYQIDSFTQTVFGGNPAGVCVLTEPLREDEMQAIASEMNLSETAFVVKKEGRYDLRWFTPAREVPLCGHATLASAFVLFSEGFHTADAPIVFDTLSGELVVKQMSDGALEMNFPLTMPSSYSGDQQHIIQSTFGPSVIDVLEVPNELIVIVDSVQTLVGLNPSMDNVARLAVNGVMVSAWDETGTYDFASRYFAPNLGINEDPVTGFIHTILSPYWAVKKGQTQFKCLQASKRRGELFVETLSNRTLIRGFAVKVFETELAM